MSQQFSLFGKGRAALPLSPKPQSPTPLMQQYLDIKKEVGASPILFYRMGDFYEMFFEDAHRAAPALDIVLTTRGRRQGQPIPMCGVPVHSSEHYIQALVKKGFEVAICEVTECQNSARRRGLHALQSREVMRLVAPSPQEGAA